MIFYLEIGAGEVTGGVYMLYEKALIEAHSNCSTIASITTPSRKRRGPDKPSNCVPGNIPEDAPRLQPFPGSRLHNTG